MVLSQPRTGLNRQWMFTAHWHENKTVNLWQKSAIFWMAWKQPRSCCWSVHGFTEAASVQLPWCTRNPEAYTAQSQVSPHPYHLPQHWEEPCPVTEMLEIIPGTAFSAQERRLLYAGGHRDGPVYLWAVHTQNCLWRETPSSAQALASPPWSGEAVLSLSTSFSQAHCVCEDSPSSCWGQSTDCLPPLPPASWISETLLENHLPSVHLFLWIPDTVQEKLCFTLENRINLSYEPYKSSQW